MHLRIAFILIASFVLSSCGSDRALEVRPTHLRNLEIEDAGKPMSRGDQRRLLYGAIGVREQEQRLGHYYVVLWDNDQVGEPVKVVFEYQQGSTGSIVHRKVQEFDGSDTSGRAEFKIVGDDYLKGGRVLAWKCSLYRGDVEVAKRHSYLWQ